MSETATTPFRASSPVDTSPRRRWYLASTFDTRVWSALAGIVIAAFVLCVTALCFISWSWSWDLARAWMLVGIYALVWSLAFVRYGVRS